MDKKKRSGRLWRKPVVIAAAALLLTFAVTLGGLCLARPADAVKIPDFSGCTAACPETFKKFQGDNIAEIELQAAAVLCRIWFASPEQRKKMVQHMQSHYSQSLAWTAVKEEFALIAARQKELADAAKKKLDEERSKKQAELDKKSLSLFASAKANTRNPVEALQKVIKDYPNTKGAAAAQEHLALLQKQAKEQQQKKEAQQERELTRKEIAAFLPSFRQALKEGKITEAQRLSAAFLGRARPALLKTFAQSCQTDVQELIMFQQGVETYFKTNLGKRIEITPAKGEKFRAKIVAVKTGLQCDIIVNSRRDTIDLLNYVTISDLLNMYAAHRTASQPAPELLHWLVLYAQGRPREAEAEWEKIKKRDPRKNTHGILLKESL